MKTRTVCHSLLLVFAAISLLGQTTPQEETTRPQQTERPAPAVDPSKPPADIRTVTPIAAVDPKSFQIGAEDILLVQVWREPDFTRQVMVRPDGKITMPLIGEVQAGGLTPEELTESLTKHLQEILKNPQVLVAVLQVNSKKYYITGEVARPGAFPLVVPTRVLEALTSAGGFREFANKKKITVLRKGERLKFNYNEVVKGKNMEQNILLENGDYIVVP